MSMTELQMTTEHMFIADPTVYTVERLLRKRKRQGSYEYLVKWRDYNFRFNTWEPESNILDQKLVDEFEERCKDTGDLFIKDDVYDAEMSDTENNERLANTPSVSPTPARGTGKRAKRKRTTRSSLKLRGGRRGKRTPVVKYEEIEDGIEERLSDEEDSPAEVKEEEEQQIIEEVVEGEAEEEEEEHVSEVEDNDTSISSPSNVRNLRKSRPTSFLPSKKRSGPQSKFSNLMKRCRKQAQTYGMQFTRNSSPALASPSASAAKLSSEEGDEQVVSDDAVDSPTQSASRRAPPKTVLTKSEKEQQKQEKERQKKKKRESMTTDEIDAEREKARDRMRQFREKQKNGSEDGEEGTNSKRKRPSRSCAVPSGFWDPVVVRTTDSGIESHSEDDDKEDILRAKRRMKNFEPAPSNYDSCYTDQPVESSNGCINDLGESVFPKKKFALKPPTLDLSKKPLSDFVFKIEDLWADKVHESSVKALGYRVKIYECKSSKTLFTKNSDKLQPGDSNQKELDT